MHPACAVSQSGGRQEGRQVLNTDMFLIIELPPLGSSQSTAHHARAHKHTLLTTTSHILGCDIEAEGVEGGEKRIYFPETLGKCSVF